MSIPDFGIPVQELMISMFDKIDEAIQQNQKVYVNCRGGIGRTGTTAGYFLARHGNGGEEALDEVNSLFQKSDRT